MHIWDFPYHDVAHQQQNIIAQSGATLLRL
jgi:hypothetical protein